MRDHRQSNGSHREQGDPEAIDISIVSEHAIIREALVCLLQTVPRIKIRNHGIESQLIENWSDPNKVFILDCSSGLTGSLLNSMMAKIKSCRGSSLLILTNPVNLEKIESSTLAFAAAIVSTEDSLDAFIAAINQAANGQTSISPSLQSQVQQIQEKTLLKEKKEPSSDFKSSISPRELDVLRCVAKGMKAKIIGENLHITTKTVERHKANLMTKLNLNSQVGLTIYAIKNGFVSI